MPRHQIIPDEKLIDLVGKNLSPANIAKKFGVSPSAIYQRLKSLKIGVAKDVTLRKAHTIVEKKVDAIEQIHKINAYANELLDLLMKWSRGDQEALRILESQVKKVKYGDNEDEVNEYKMKDPRELALKAMAEIRGQLKLQLEIFQALYDMTAVAEFQKEVLEVIGTVNPEARDQIIRALQEKRAIRTTLEFDNVL
jgi:hypothetical protein